MAQTLRDQLGGQTGREEESCRGVPEIIEADDEPSLCQNRMEKPPDEIGFSQVAVCGHMTFTARNRWATKLKQAADSTETFRILIGPPWLPGILVFGVVCPGLTILRPPRNLGNETLPSTAAHLHFGIGESQVEPQSKL
jgi:hypothetical protein